MIETSRLKNVIFFQTTKDGLGENNNDKKTLKS